MLAAATSILLAMKCRTRIDSLSQSGGVAALAPYSASCRGGSFEIEPQLTANVYCSASRICHGWQLREVTIRSPSGTRYHMVGVGGSALYVVSPAVH